jgi:hypothetical protein
VVFDVKLRRENRRLREDVDILKPATGGRLETAPGRSLIS